jgi:hypothetical protein
MHVTGPSILFALLIAFAVLGGLTQWAYLAKALGKKRRGRAHRQSAQQRVARAQEVFAQLAERHRLRLEWDDQKAVSLAASLPRQPGLDWSLWLNLQDDEIGVQSPFFYVEWFPSDDPKEEASFVEVVDGLLDGSVRLVCKFGSRGALPYSVSFEKAAGSGWDRVYWYARGLHLGRPKGVMILRNGHDPVVQGRAAQLPLPA